MEPITMALTAAAVGGSLLSGAGSKASSAKQGRLQMMEDERIRQINAARVEEINARRERLGRELLTIEEVQEVENNSWQHTSQWGDIDVDAFMADGAKAGFNPVTWLQSGALSAYYRSEGLVQNGGVIRTTSRGHNAAEAFKMMMPDYSLAQPSQIPMPVSNLSIFGNALSAGANAFGTAYRADQAYDLNMQKLMTAQSLQGLGLSANSFGMAVPAGRQGYGGTADIAGGLSVGGSGRPGQDMVWPMMAQSSPILFENKVAESTNPFPYQMGWKIPPGYANAEAYEDTFGEMVSWPYGVVKFGNTLLYNMTGNTLEGHAAKAYNRVPSGPLSSWYTTPPKPNMTRYSGSAFSQGGAAP